MQEYTELLQYMPWVDISKVAQLENVKKSSNNRKYAVGIKYFTFNEYVSAIESGHSIKRIHTYKGEFIPTRFVTIDIDDEEARVTENEIRSFESDTCKVTKSTSGNPYKWHVHILSDFPCMTTQDLYNVTNSWIKTLTDKLDRFVRFDTKLTNTWGQWVYGVPQETHAYEILSGTIEFCKQISKVTDYKFIKVDPDEKRQVKNYVTIPFKQKDVAAFIGTNTFEDKTYKINLVWKNGHVEKISDGFRYKYGMSWVLNLVAQYFKLTKKYGKDISYDDLVMNLKSLCNRYFEDGTKCKCFPQLISWMTELYKELKNKDYSYIEGMMNGKIHDYMTDSYRRDMILKVRNTLRYDENTNNFVETDRATLLRKLSELNISEATFRRHINRMGFGLVYETKMARSDKGSKYGLYIETCKKIGDLYIVDRKHMMNKKFKEFCVSNNIQISSKNI